MNVAAHFLLNLEALSCKLVDCSELSIRISNFEEDRMRFALKLGMVALVMCAASAMRAEEDPKMPDWVPAFPGSTPKLIENKKSDKEVSVIWYFTTTKTPVEVKDFYKKGFEAQGFKDLKVTSVDDKEDKVQQENLKSDDGKRYWYISARLEKDAKETQVSLVYQIKN